MVRLNTSSSPAQFRKLTPRSRAWWMSSDVRAVAPCEARPSRQTGLPNAAAGRCRNDDIEIPLARFPNQKRETITCRILPMR